MIKEKEKALEFHKEWMKKLEAVISDGVFDLETDPQKCGFGIFYKSMVPPSGIEEIWERIGNTHEELHKVASKILMNIKNGDKESAQKLFEEAKGLSKELISTLDECEKECKDVIEKSS